MSSAHAKNHLKSAIELGRRRLTNDLRALSDQGAAASPGGCARSALDIVAECAVLNGVVAAYLTSGEFVRPPREEAVAYRRTFDSAAKALALLDRETDQLLAVVDSLDEATLWDAAEGLPFNRPMTRFSIAELPAMHMSYHDGQLNYIHTLLGDDAVHWG